jgi:uncharacterized membrane protein YhaH (DUF805 family)
MTSTVESGLAVQPEVGKQGGQRRGPSWIGNLAAGVLFVAYPMLAGFLGWVKPVNGGGPATLTSRPQTGSELPMLICALFLVLVWLASGVRRFPRWSDAFLGLGLAIGWSVLSTQAGFDQSGGYLGLIVFAALILLIVAAGQALPLLSMLYDEIADDKIRVAFIYYGALPLFLVKQMGAASNSLPFQLALGALLMAGALVHLRFSRSWGRSLALLVCFPTAWYLLIDQLKESYHGPYPWFQSPDFRSLVLEGIILFLMISFPLLVHLLSHESRYERPYLDGGG